MAGTQHRSSHPRERSVATKSRSPSCRRRQSKRRSISRARCDAASGALTRCQPHAAINETMSGTAAFFHAMAPALIANVLTVAFVYCFAVINKQERSGEDEGRLTYLIVMVFLFMLYGLYTWGVYPFDSRTERASSGRRSDTRRTRRISPTGQHGSIAGPIQPQLLLAQAPCSDWLPSTGRITRAKPGRPTHFKRCAQRSSKRGLALRR